MGSVLREGTDRCLNVVVFGGSGGEGGGGLVAAQDGGKCVDLFRVRSEGEAKKKMRRRVKVGEGREGVEMCECVCINIY